MVQSNDQKAAAVLAIQARIAGDRRVALLDDLYDAAAAEDAELLDRLAQ